MKIIVPQKTLLTALTRIQGIAEKTSIMPITSNALINATESVISVSSTNLQIGMKAKYNDVKVQQEGSISVNARRIFEIIREFPDKDITLTEKENYRIEIKCGENLNFNIIGLPPEDFPMIFETDEENKIEWEIEKIINMIELTSFSISKDEANPNICGAYIEKFEKDMIRMVTTDGYRLSIVDKKLGDEFLLDEGIIIPYKAVIEFYKLLIDKKDAKKFLLFTSKKSFLAKIGEIEFFVRLIEKKFPDYRIIVPEEGYKKIEILIEKEKIKPTLRRMSIISHENNRPVIFSFKDNKVEIFTEDSELGNVKEIIKLNQTFSEEISFCINCLYLLDILNAVDEDIIIDFNLEEENKPIVVRPVNKKNIKYVIMPMVLD